MSNRPTAENAPPPETEDGPVDAKRTYDLIKVPHGEAPTPKNIEVVARNYASHYVVTATKEGQIATATNIVPTMQPLICLAVLKVVLDNVFGAKPSRQVNDADEASEEERKPDLALPRKELILPPGVR